ncbi:hypothetical protein J3Q64DRAFT_1722497, partial [Phycomyces blakesleeanus]
MKRKEMVSCFYFTSLFSLYIFLVRLSSFPFFILFSLPLLLLLLAFHYSVQFDSRGAAKKKDF